MMATLTSWFKKYFIDDNLVGFYIGPFGSLFVRGIISVAAGFLLATIMYYIDFFAGTDLLNYVTWFGLIAIFAVYVGWTEEKVTVPVNHVAFVTFLGRRRKIFLREGEYYWIGRRFFLDISRSPLANAKNVARGKGEEEGFVYVGNRTVQIWNSRQNKNITLTLPTRAGSTVTTNLTIKIVTRDPMKWAHSDDPILQVAEQARAGLRKALTFFRDTDVSGAKSAVVALISGKRVITSFTTKKVGSSLIGTMIQDTSGLPMYEVVEVKPGEDAEGKLRLAKEKFIERMESDGNPVIVEVAKDNRGKLIIAELNIEEKLSKAVDELGAFIENVVISDAQLSDTVRIASEAAASEGAQREQQTTSADTQVEVMKKLADARKGTMVDDLDRLLAASADGNKGVQVVHVSGSESSLIKAAVAAGKQIGGNKE